MRRILSVLSAALVAVAPSAHAGGTADTRVNTAEATEVTSLCNEERDVSLARSGNQVVAGWTGPGTCQANQIPAPGDSGAAVAWSSDGGATWTEGEPLPLGSAGATYGPVHVAAHTSGRFLYLLSGADYAPSAASDPYRPVLGVYRSDDGGRTWSDPVDVSRVAEAGHGVSTLDIAVDDVAGSPHRGTTYVVWHEYSGNSFDDNTFLARSTDGGVTFDTPRLLNGGRSNGLQTSFGPQGEVYLTWMSGTTLMFSRSLDGGDTFSPPAVVRTLSRIGHLADCGPVWGFRYVLDGELEISQHPSIAVDTYPGTEDEDNPAYGRIYVTVPADGPSSDEADVFLMTSDDRGATWSSPRRVNDDGTATDQFHPRVAVDGQGRVGLMWHDRRSNADNLASDVYGAVSVDGGATFSPGVRVSDVSTDPPSGLGFWHHLNGCFFPHQRNALVPVESGFLAGWVDNRNGTPEDADLDVFVDVLGG